MKKKTETSSEQSPPAEGQVELVAGPQCGLRVRWPEGEAFIRVGHPYGEAVYQIEPKLTTAIYVEG